MNEVYAHAVVGKHPHVVRYYSAWAENDHMYIQDEYCNGMCSLGSIRLLIMITFHIQLSLICDLLMFIVVFAGGSLAEKVGRNQRQGMRLSELDLKQILLQISKGLLYIHSQNLVHLDLKPGRLKSCQSGSLKYKLSDRSNLPF